MLNVHNINKIKIETVTFVFVSIANAKWRKYLHLQL